jgi:hypothetical protein
LELWLGYLHFHASLAGEIDHSRQQDIARPQKFLAAVTAKTGMSEALFTKIATSAQPFVTRYNAAELKREQNSRSASAPRPLSAAETRQIQTARRMSIAAAISDLQQKLSASEWN